MNTNYETIVDENQRMIILSLLKADAGFAMNEDVLQSALEIAGGYKVSADKLRTELGWLKEQGLIKLETLQQLWVAKITQRGLDVAGNRTSVPGVQRPRPSA